MEKTSPCSLRQEIPQHLGLFASVAKAWYCDSVSILRKLLQARENGVGKTAFWVLGAEEPRLWEMLEDFPVPFIPLSNVLQ